jgi:hypothetical protein
MYGIIYWLKNDNAIFFVDNEDKSIKVFKSIEEADKEAEKVFESRVISLEGVQA